MAERVIELDEKKIDGMAQVEPWFFDMRPCDLEGDDLGVHTWLKVRLTLDDKGEISSTEVIDCDRKNER